MESGSSLRLILVYSRDLAIRISVTQISIFSVAQYII